MSRAKSSAVKEALMTQIKGRIDFDEIREWLWEDFGIRVRGGWEEMKRIIVSDTKITPQDVAAFMISEGVEPDERAWDIVPVPRGLRGRIEDNGSGKA